MTTPLLSPVATSGPLTTNVIHCGDALAVLRCLPDESVHCLVTSPPYYGLRNYGGVDGQLGLEDTPRAYLERMVAIFREARRVLRSDGVCWCNMGDSYAGSSTTGGTNSIQGAPSRRAVMFDRPKQSTPGFKPKDLMLMPHRLAIALQSDGWWVRSAAPWVKGSAMPESTRDRATTAHEYVFQLAKSAHYWFDADAVRKNQADSSLVRAMYGWNGITDDNSNGARTGSSFKRMAESGEPMRTIPADGGRNRRTSDTFYEHLDAQITHWQHVRKHGGALVSDDTIDALLVNPAGYAEAHFATYPPDLIRPCIRAGCPERVCPVCGRGWVREVERTRVGSLRGDNHLGDIVEGRNAWPKDYRPPITLGFRPDCDCDAPDSVPGIVLDPFIGSGTTALVAVQERRRYVGIELNPDYIDLAKRRFMTGPEKLNAKESEPLEDLPLFAAIEKESA